jgi:uncharacterized GH25 family protein
MIKKISLLLVVWIIILPVLAHEFWLAPAQYRAQAGEKIAISFLVGEGFKGEKWGARGKRLEKFIHHSPKKEYDLTDLAKTDTSQAAIQVLFKENGTHLLAMTSSNSYIELDGEKFNAYLEEDGIEDIYAQRIQNNQKNAPAREFYSRCAKTLVQIGNKTTSNFQKIVGTPLEIVPLQNPYTLKIGDTFSVKILFKNQILPNASIKIWHRTNSEPVKPQDVKSDAQGMVSLQLKSGEYMISLVKMIPYTDTQQADYQSYWASLTFGL